jgi:ubiquinone biosynthesis protein
VTALSHAWRLTRTIIRYRLFDLLRIAPFDSLPRPWWLRLLAAVFGSRSDPATVGQSLRAALIDLGPVYIKLGQLLSTRADVIPASIAGALAALQDNVPAFPGPVAMTILQDSCNKPVNQIFSWIDEQPLASASIAQVHAARLLSGEEVVVKIKRPDIEQLIEETLSFLRALARHAQSRSELARRLQLLAIIEDYDRTIHAELDLAQEARNTAQLRSNFAHSAWLYVPRPYLALSNNRVLVLERIHGVPISDNAALDRLGVDKALLADRGVRTFFKQVFVDNFFHADMHPGNVFVDVSNPADPKYIALDCAIIGSLTDTDQNYLARNLVAFFNRDYRKVAELYLESGWVPSGTDPAEFASVIEAVCEPHFEKPLGEISFGALLTDLFNTAQRFNMQIQPQLILLQKTLLYIEGLGRSLYPQLDLWQTAKPFMEAWLLERTGPAALLQRVISGLPDIVQAIAEMPSWLPQARGRLLSLERQLAQQADRLAELESGMHSVHRRHRTQQWAAAVLLVAGTLLLLEPVIARELQLNLLQASAGAIGAAGGLMLLVRSLI